MGVFNLTQLLNEAVQITFNLDGGLNYRGAYDNGTAYVLGDVVYYQGSSYIAYQATTGNLPTNTSFWYVLANKGDTGAQGLKGDTGNQGTQGVKGDTGSTGSQGSQGATGVKGDTGNTGAKGDTGTAGSAGSAGAKGDTGDQGDTGIQGDTGATGSAGSAGAKGDTGTAGAQGATGVKGDTGNAGAKGDTGSQGSAGAKGDTGDAGAQGDQGDTGATGSQGVKGDTGNTGAKGDTGNTGSQGVKGDTGNTGAQGATGVTGAQGATGVKGDTGNPGGVSFYQTFDSATTEADPGAGEFRLNHATLSSVTEIYIDDADAGATDIIDLVAAFDDAGNPVKGFLEIRRSSAPTNWVLYRINSLTDEAGYTQLNVAYVDHAGTITGLCEMLFSRAGDKGDTGSQGVQGATGVTGAKGDTGNTGSQGAKGDTGDQGVQGDQGDTGATGSQGVKGDTGNTGSQGVKGDTGNTGAQGATGVTGAQGATGVTGSQGATGVKGDTGHPGALSVLQTFDSTTTEADPGNGEFRLNHATLSSVTEIYVDDLDSGGTDIIDLVASFDDASNPVKGFLQITRVGAPTNWALYRINSITDEAGYTQLNVAYVDHAGTITGECVLSFSRTGDKGDTGATGSQGVQGDTGATGSQGTQGATGTQGVKGDTGNTGSQGVKGDTGNTGSQGVKGDTGNTGSQGATGVTGATGAVDPITINAQTASYTLVLGDAQKLIDMNVGSANNLTVPPNASVAFATGTRIAVRQKGAGQTTLVPDTGVTINSQGSALKLAGQYAMCLLVKVATNEWNVEGNLTT